MESPHTHLAYYPVPFAILVAWISYIVFMFVQLEDAVTISNWGGFTNSRQEVLTLLLTVFAQAHTPITAMVLTRLAVGALSSDATAPKTWLEVFFLADGNWQGPLGIGRALWISYRRRTRLSSTFALFGVTMLLSLPQPLLISRAYPYQVITTEVPISYSHEIGQFTVGDYFATGLTAWRVASGDYYQGFKGAFYLANESTNGDAPLNEVFSTVPAQFPAVSEPALWLDGSCVHLNNTPNLPSSGASPDFDIWCSAHGLHTSSAEQLVFAKDPLNFAMHWCSNVNLSSWDPSRSEATSASVVAWLNATGPSEMAIEYLDNRGSLGASRTHVEGLVNCTYSVMTGSATLSRSNSADMSSAYPITSTYSDFEASRSSGMLANYPGTISPPVYATYAVLAQNYALDPLTIPRLFFEAYELYDSNFTPLTYYYLSRSADMGSMAGILTNGVRTMHAALATLGMPETSNGSTPRSSPTRVRKTAVLIAAVVMLLAWLISLILCCRWMFSRTFSGSLNSYVVARLLVENAHLVEEQPLGDLSNNPNLDAPFAHLHGPPAPYDHGLLLRAELADVLVRIRRRRERRSMIPQTGADSGDLGEDVALEALEESLSKHSDLDRLLSAPPSLKHLPNPWV